MTYEVASGEVSAETEVEREVRVVHVQREAVGVGAGLCGMRGRDMRGE